MKVFRTMSGFLGIMLAVGALTLLTGSSAEAAKAAKIKTVLTGSAADDAGLVKGDLILEINDQKIQSLSELKSALLNSGGDATILVRHGNGQTELLEASFTNTLGVNVQIVNVSGPVFFSKKVKPLSK